MPLILSGTDGVSGNSGAIVSGTAVTVSGTSADFPNIPSWAKRVTVIFSGVSTNGTAGLGIRIGDSGGISATGYQSTSVRTASGLANVDSTTEFNIASALAADVISGSVTLCNVTSNTWVISGVFSWSSGVVMCTGAKTLSGTLTQVRVIPLSTNSFDAGTINILYE